MIAVCFRIRLDLCQNQLNDRQAREENEKENVLISDSDLSVYVGLCSFCQVNPQYHFPVQELSDVLHGVIKYFFPDSQASRSPTVW